MSSSTNHTIKSALASETEFLDELVRFIKPVYKWPQARWIYGANLRLYVRKGPRYIAGQPYDTVTISTIEVHAKQQGIYSDLLQFVEAYGQAVYVENVFNREQDRIYLKRGFTAVPSEMPDFCQSFYKILDLACR